MSTIPKRPTNHIKHNFIGGESAACIYLPYNGVFVKAGRLGCKKRSGRTCLTIFCLCQEAGIPQACCFKSCKLKVTLQISEVGKIPLIKLMQEKNACQFWLKHLFLIAFKQIAKQSLCNTRWLYCTLFQRIEILLNIIQKANETSR